MLESRTEYRDRGASMAQEACCCWAAGALHLGGGGVAREVGRAEHTRVGEHSWSLHKLGVALHLRDVHCLRQKQPGTQGVPHCTVGTPAMACDRRRESVVRG